MPSTPTVTQVSAGGVACRMQGEKVEVALIRAGTQGRWQLPKGMANRGESLETAAQREVREEAGIKTDLLCPLERIEYWYFSGSSKQRTRFHKFVSFYLMRYVSGNVNDHDHEVTEARWVEIDDAIEMLSFESEKNVMRKAKKLFTDGKAWECDPPLIISLEKGETPT